MTSIQNANPTILAASDLPTRRPLSSASVDDTPLGILADVMPPEVSYDPFDAAAAAVSSDSDADADAEPIDAQEIYDLIATISDPEHPLSLGSLAVVNLPDIQLEPLTGPAPPSGSPAAMSAAGGDLTKGLQRVTVQLTPTISHCSLATVIGLGVRVRLEQALPPRYRVDVRIKPGTHASADEVNKQLGDKERVAAALENRQLWGVLRKMMETCV